VIRLSAIFLSLALSIASLTTAGAPAKVTIPTGGQVPQDVAMWLHEGTGRTMLAVVNAFSDNVVLFEREDDEEPFLQIASFTTGKWAGTNTDLPRRVVATDLDHDGWTDVLVLNSGNYQMSQGGSLQALYARENGQWYVPPAWSIGSPSAFPTNLCVAESSQDGPTWIAVGFSNANQVGVYRHLGAGQFTPSVMLPLTHTTPAVAWVDLDGDSQPELAAGGSNRVSVIDVTPNLLPAGPSLTARYTIVGPSGRSILAIAAGDATNDGRMDLVASATQGSGQPGSLLLVDGPAAAGTAPGMIELTTALWGSTEFTDIKAADCTGDGVLDWMISDRDNDLARMVVGPLTGSLATISVSAGNGPRRVLVADVDRSGVPDVISADENANVLTVTFNYGGTSLNELSLAPEAPWHAPAQVPVSYRRIGLYSAFTDIAYLISDPVANALVQLDVKGTPTGSLSFASCGLISPASAWGDDGGLYDEMYVTSWGSNVITKIEFGAVADTISVTPPPSVAGLGGICEARLDDARGSVERPRIWVLAPGARRLLGVDEDSGYVVEYYSLSQPFTSLAIDDDAEIAYFGSTEDPAVYQMPLTYGVASPPVTRLPLSNFTNDLTSHGVASLCWENSPGLIVMTTDHAIVGLGNPAAAEPLSFDPVSYSTGWKIVSISSHPTNGEVFALDAGSPGQVLVFNGNSGALIRRIGIDQARSGGYSDLRPNLIAIDAVANELLIAEGSTGRVVRLNPFNGNRLGEFAWSGSYADGLVGLPWKGMAVDEWDGQMLVLGPSKIVKAPRHGGGASVVALVPETATGLALSAGDFLFYVDGQANRLVLTPYGSNIVTRRVSLAAATGGGLLGRRRLVAGSNQANRLLLIEPKSGRIEPVTWSMPLAAASWDLYE